MPGSRFDVIVLLTVAVSLGFGMSSLWIVNPLF